jgi:beta-glucosidase-like glycosyl hydrolase
MKLVAVAIVLGVVASGSVLDLRNPETITPAGPCVAEPGKSAVWCDPTKDIETRVAALVSNLTDEEKAGLFVNSASAVKRINWPGYNWWSEALHGIARDGLGTSFPQICGIGATYNKTLFHSMGEVVSTEARGKNNALDGKLYHGLTLWAPNVNIFRDPRWGRGQETPGEDPTLTSDYAHQYVSGLQGDDKKYLKSSSCIKHYAAYSEETGRNSFPAVVTSQDMEDTYLPAFQSGVENGKASGIMCSYNAETYGNGVYGNGTQGGAIPSCANKGILNDLARDKWGFDGYITSDCGAVSNVQNQHHYTNTTDQTVTAVLSAGMDTDCGGFMSGKVMGELIKDKKIDPKLITTALSNLFRVQIRLGFLDPREMVPWAGYGPEVVNTPANQALAKEAADQSLVLLKNAKVGKSMLSTLPFKNGKTMKLAVIGRNANATNNMQGNYFGTAPYLVSPWLGLKAATDTEPTYADGSDVAAASALAKDADAVVLVVGLTSEGVPHNDEAEGHDRTSLIMPNKQDALVSAVAAAAGGKPVILIVMGGGPVDVSAAKANPAIGAIIWCGYPGQSGGTSIADALMGNTNRFGKLSLTWYPEEFTKQVKASDMGMRPNKATGNPGRTYRFYTGTPVFKFGEGMTYTNFDTSLALRKLTADELPDNATDVRTLVEEEAAITQSLTHISASKVVDATVTVTNSGDMAGDHVALLFASAPAGIAGQDGNPIQSLVAYERVTLQPGETTTVSLDVTTRALTLIDEYGEGFTAGGEWKFWLGVQSDATDAMSASLAL